MFRTDEINICIDCVNDTIFHIKKMKLMRIKLCKLLYTFKISIIVNLIIIINSECLLCVQNNERSLETHC